MAASGQLGAAPNAKRPSEAGARGGYLVNVASELADLRPAGKWLTHRLLMQGNPRERLVCDPHFTDELLHGLDRDVRINEVPLTI